MALELALELALLREHETAVAAFAARVGAMSEAAWRTPRAPACASRDVQ